MRASWRDARPRATTGSSSALEAPPHTSDHTAPPPQLPPASKAANALFDRLRADGASQPSLAAARAALHAALGLGADEDRALLVAAMEAARAERTPTSARDAAAAARDAVRDAAAAHAAAAAREAADRSGAPPELAQLASEVAAREIRAGRGHADAAAAVARELAAATRVAAAEGAATKGAWSAVEAALPPGMSTLRAEDLSALGAVVEREEAAASSREYERELAAARRARGVQSLIDDELLAEPPLQTPTADVMRRALGVAAAATT